MDNTEKDNTKEVFELEKQLHAQYATNASANTSSFFAFLVSILAVFYAFGYVNIFNTNEFAGDGKLFTINDGHVEFTLDVLAYISSISIILLAFLVCYCLELAWQQRRDQIIINNIRKKYFNDKQWEIIFWELYSPKGKDWYYFLPNIYRIFIVLFIILKIIIVVVSLIKLYESVLDIVMLIIVLIFGLLYVITKWKETYSDYKRNAQNIRFKNKKK